MEHVVIHTYIGHPDQPSHGSYVDICITRCCHIFSVASLCARDSQGYNQASQKYLGYCWLMQLKPCLDLRRVLETCVESAFRVANSGLASSLARAPS